MSRAELDPVTHEDPAYARGWNDALSLRDAASAALTDFIYEHGSDFTPELWPGMTALQAALFEAAPHGPGDPHQYRIECGVCGQRGQVYVAIHPERASLDLDHPSPSQPVAEEGLGRWHHHQCLLADRAHPGNCVVPPSDEYEDALLPASQPVAEEGETHRRPRAYHVRPPGAEIGAEPTWEDPS